MFDTPDLAPLCYAPFVAVLAAAAVYAVLRGLVFFINRRAGYNPAESQRSARELSQLILVGCAVLVPFLETLARLPGKGEKSAYLA